MSGNAFASSDAVIARQADMFANRVQKNFARLAKGFARQNVEAFRLYDRDIPEIRAVADWYAGHLVVGEYARTQTDDLPGWLESIADAAAAALQVPPEQVHCRRRRTRPAAGERYRRLATTGVRVPVRESALTFLVNLDDYLDTGLFADHRETRKLVAAECAGRAVLNLFCYTGGFTVAAAVGGAQSTCSVDTSAAYLAWLQDNLRENGCAGPMHTTKQVDARTYLDWAERYGPQYDVVVCDPPSFSVRRDTDFAVQSDHRELVAACLRVVKPGGCVWFSTNHQRFVSDIEGLGGTCEDFSARTIPPDYRNRLVHQVWRLTAADPPSL